MGLYEKMYNVMCQSEGLKKDMQVGEGKNSYKAIGEASVLNTIKPLLKENRLVIFPVKCVVDETHTEYQGKYGMSQRFLTKLVVDYKIVDIDSGEFDILESIGYGTDTQDKGSGQAMTYAYKALLQKTFCLFSGEDTDNQHSEQKEKESSFQQQDTSKVSLMMLTDIIAKAGKTEQEYIDWYNGKEGVKSITDLKFMPQETKQHLYSVLSKKVGK